MLDQFSRNLYRDDPHAFASDPMALVLAQELVSSGGDRELPIAWRAFAYTSFMHSKSPRIHEVALQLFNQPSLEGNLKFEHAHKATIDHFGRYPHRNAVLGYDSTSWEIAFL